MIRSMERVMQQRQGKIRKQDHPGHKRGESHLRGGESLLRGGEAILHQMGQPGRAAG